MWNNIISDLIGNLYRSGLTAVYFYNTVKLKKNTYINLSYFALES